MHCQSHNDRLRMVILYLCYSGMHGMDIDGNRVVEFFVRMIILTLELPWPPSVNHYWGQRGKRRYLTSKALLFRHAVLKIFRNDPSPFPPSDRLSLEVQLFPPDKRRRDIDNVLKGLLDSLQHAGVFKDDNQIDRLAIVREPELSNRCIVTIQSL